MSTLHEKHMKLIDNVNNATSNDDRYRAYILLEGWRDGVRDSGVNLGNLLINADLEQIERGNDKPMCCGIFL